MAPAQPFLHRHPVMRWLVPAGVVGAVIAGAVGTLSAQASVHLPARTAAQLLADVETASVDGYSGTIVQRANLGLPEIPQIAGAGQSSGSALALLSGSHTARVWMAGASKQRFAMLDSVGETDLFRNGSDVWTWNSRTKTATHTVMADLANAPKPTTGALTPDQLANRAIKALNPSTLVTTDDFRKVAGRDAYELVLTPRDPATKVGSVRIAVDGQSKIPLAVQVYSRKDSQQAAIDVSFTDIVLDVPADSNFVWSPPKGGRVTQTTPEASPLMRAIASPKALGSAWTTVFAAHAGLPTGSAGQSVAAALVPVSGAWGSGKMLDAPLLSILVTDDGRSFIGAVAPDALYAAAASYR